MNDNMLHSMATSCLGTDVALIKIMEQGKVSNVIRLYHADLPRHRGVGSPHTTAAPRGQSTPAVPQRQRANGNSNGRTRMKSLITARTTHNITQRREEDHATLVRTPGPLHAISRLEMACSGLDLSPIAPAEP
jgi:hypothetical protein